MTRMNALPVRKNIRLQGYDYSQAGCYYVTICAVDRLPLFGQIIESDNPVHYKLIEKSEIGRIVAECWDKINGLYNSVDMDAFYIMPNHIHGIVVIKDICAQNHPSLPKIIQGFKSVTARMCFEKGYRTIWQRGYHERIIHNENEYRLVCRYIHTNPYRCSEDEYY